MDAWVDAIQKVKEVQANKVLKSQLEEIKNGVAAFAGVYDTYNIKYPDPHRKWYSPHETRHDTHDTQTRRTPRHG